MTARHTYIFCLLIATAVGFWCGRWSNHPGHTHRSDFDSSPEPGPKDASSGTQVAGNQVEFDLLDEIDAALAAGAWHQNRHWDTILRDLSRPEIDSGLARLRGAPSSTVNGKLTQALYFRWAELDPLVALERAKVEIGGPRREAAIKGVMEGWAFTDPVAMSDWVNTTQNDELSHIAAKALAPHLAAIDPARAFAFAVASTPRGRANPELFREILGAWGQTEPTVALAAVNEHLTHHLRQLSRMEVYNSWARTDPPSAAIHALNQPARSDRAYALPNVLKLWASVDAEAALAFVRSSDLGVDHANAMAAITFEMAAQDPEAALAVAETMPLGPARSEVLSKIIESITSVDAELAAVIYASAVRSGEEIHGNTAEIGRGYAQVDPAAALAWAIELPNNDARYGALLAVSEGAAGGNARVVVESALRLPAGSEQRMVLAQVFRELAKQNPSGAVDLYRSFPTNTFPESVRHNIIGSAASANPVIALSMVESMTEPGARAEAVQPLISGWAQIEPRAAATWLAEQNWIETAPLISAAHSIIMRWGVMEPRASADWIRTLPNAENQQALWPVLIEQIRQDRPADAASMVSEITDPHIRIGQTRAIAKRWLMYDSATAIPWVQRSDLPEEEKVSLIRSYGG